MSAASAARSTIKDFCSTSAATASSRSRRRSSTSGTRSCPTISSSARASRRIYYDGKHYSYPLKAFEALSNLGVVESALCVLSYAYKKAFPNANPENFREWVSNQFGDRLFSIFFKTYTEKVWGMSCDEISADWAAQRIKGLDLWSAMANALRRSIGTSAETAGERQGHQDADRELPVSAQGSRHDVGRGCRKGEGAGRRYPHGHASSRACRGTTKSGVWTITASTAHGAAHLHRPPRHLVGADPRADGMRSSRRLSHSPRPRSCATAISSPSRSSSTSRTCFPTTGSTSTSRTCTSAASRISARGRRRWCRTRNAPASGSSISASRATGCGPLPTPS